MPETDNMSVTADLIDEDYINTMGMQLIAGENLSRQDVADVSREEDTAKSYHFILNESAAKALGWTPAEAIGKMKKFQASIPLMPKASLTTGLWLLAVKVMMSTHKPYSENNAGAGRVRGNRCSPNPCTAKHYRQRPVILPPRLSYLASNSCIAHSEQLRPV